MVTRDEWIPSGAIDLVGLLHLPEGAGPFPGVVVCHPHPQYGGDMENNVVVAVCEALVERGIAALRFNFRGVGRSGGSFDRGVGESDDALAAARRLAMLTDVAPERVGLAGYSFGALVGYTATLRWGSLGLDAPAPVALALISPPPQPLSATELAALPVEALLLLAGDRDPIAPAAAIRALDAGTPGRQTEIVAGADHSWSGHEAALSGIVGPFFSRHLGSGEG